MESGATIDLLACPCNLTHGSEEHVAWLFTQPAAGSDPVWAAAGASINVGKDQADIDASHAKPTQASSMVDAGAISVADALEFLVRNDKAKVYACRCIACDKTLFVKWTHHLLHTCAPVRAAVRPLLEARHESAKAIAASAVVAEAPSTTAGANANALDTRLGVTRCSPSIEFAWVVGERIDEHCASLDVKKLQHKVKFTDRVHKGDPQWNYVMDMRARLRIGCFEIREFSAPHLLIQAVGDSVSAFDITEKLRVIDPLHPLAAEEYKAHLDADFDKSLLQARQADPWAARIFLPWSDVTDAQEKVMFRRQVDAITGKQPKAKGSKKPVYSEDDIRLAYLERIDVNKLKPLFMSADYKLDELDDAQADESDSETSTNEGTTSTA